jgi:hypothetical protein
MALLRYAVVSAAALAMGFPVAVMVGSLGLVVPGGVILPVTFGVSAAFAALGAAWVSNLLAWGRSHARIASVLVWTEATALVMLVLLMGVSYLGGAVSMSFFMELLVSTIPIALNAAILSMRLREPGTRYGRDVALGLAVGIAAVLAPILLLFVACPYIGCTG